MFENRPPVPKPRRTSALAIAGMILAALGMVAALYTFANIPNTTRVEIERSPTGAWTGTRVVRDTSYVIGYFTIPLVLSVLGSVLAVIGLARKSASTLSIVAGVFGIIGGSLGLLLSVLGLWANLI